eukprot:TRINITY_DN8770_c0_g1_i1.p1 TRINITY_DN8770_c0_g1~~TRINITY_DN8770_c0_g1_i1.p1  ORF type:complete len:164 (+),score=37.14 TRINITY_DN8770_c0_g1_i1:71-562(+)
MPIRCKYCKAEGLHLSMRCPDKPDEARAGELPPPEANEYGPTEIEDSKRIAEEMHAENLQAYGLLAPAPDPEKVKGFQMSGAVQVASAEYVKEALGVYWHDGLAPYCARRGVVVRMMNARNAFVEFHNDPPINAVRRCQETIPCVCLEPIPDVHYDANAGELC